MEPYKIRSHLKIGHIHIALELRNLFEHDC
jgi:hypothetical protein